MISRLHPLQAPETVFPVFAKPAAKADFVPQGSFVEELKKAILDVDKLQKTADQQQQDLVVGNAQSLHEVMLALEKAAVAVEMTLAVRTLVVDGYREIMRMQV